MLVNDALAHRPAGTDFSAGVEPAELHKGWMMCTDRSYHRIHFQALTAI